MFDNDLTGVPNLFVHNTLRHTKDEHTGYIFDREHHTLRAGDPFDRQPRNPGVLLVNPSQRLSAFGLAGIVRAYPKLYRNPVLTYFARDIEPSIHLLI